MLRAGIIGLPNVGKSTLFNALTKTRSARVANYPFCTIEKNVGLVTVPDPRLAPLTNIMATSEDIPAAFELVDIAGLVKGASKGEGLGNKFLADIRDVDAIVHVVRCFESRDVIHVSDTLDPLTDIETVTAAGSRTSSPRFRKRTRRITSRRTASESRVPESSSVPFIGSRQARLADGPGGRPLPAREVEGKEGLDSAPNASAVSRGVQRRVHR